MQPPPRRRPPGRLVAGGRERLLECPDCGKEKLYQNVSSGKAYCHVCGERKLLDSSGLSSAREVHERSLDATLDLGKRQDSSPSPRRWILPVQVPVALGYLRKRSVDPRHERIRAHPLSSQAARLSFWNPDHQLVATRDIHARRVRLHTGSSRSSIGVQYEKTKEWTNPDGPGYWYLPGEIPALGLCEGPFDGLRIHEAGYHAACLLGKGTSGERVGRILRDVGYAPARLIQGRIRSCTLLLDADATREADLLSAFLTRWGWDIRDRTPELARLGLKDPGEATVEQLKRILE